MGTNIPRAVAVGDSVERALSFGAAVKIPFKVVDETGNPVSGAKISVGLFLWTDERNSAKGMTDQDGIFTVKGKATDEVSYFITKEGYYYTNGKYHLSQQPGANVKNGKWMPYGKERQVVLKRKVNPIPMSAVDKTYYLPKLKQPFGFDALEMDWVEPVGKGKHVDILVTFDGDGSEEHDRPAAFQLAWADKDCGFYEADPSDSELASPHHADTNQSFRASVSLVSTRDFKFGGWIDPMAGKCIVFRIRPRYSPDGVLIAVRYGKIYGPINHHYTDRNGAAAGFDFRLYANPTENDTNLEFLPYHSLNYPNERSKQPNIAP